MENIFMRALALPSERGEANKGWSGAEWSEESSYSNQLRDDCSNALHPIDCLANPLSHSTDPPHSSVSAPIRFDRVGLGMKLKSVKVPQSSLLVVGRVVN